MMTLFAPCWGKMRNIAKAFTLYLLLLINISLPALAQEKDSLAQRIQPVYLLRPNVAAAFPTGLMSERFGVFLDVGFSASKITSTRWTYGIGGNFLAGGNIKQEPMGEVYNDRGFAIGSNGNPMTVNTIMRGYNAKFLIGKVIPIKMESADPASGILIETGWGWHWNQINIQDQGRTLQLVLDERKKWFDHLRGGPQFTISTGFLYLAKEINLNLFVAIDYQIAYTYNLRSYSFTELVGDDEQAFNNYFSVRLHWIIPVRRKKNQRQVFFY